LTGNWRQIPCNHNPIEFHQQRPSTKEPRIKMKFVAAILSLTASMASAAVKMPNSIKVDSKMGNSIMSKARRLEQDAEVDFTWVADYSIRFQGCHHISQWNGDEDNNNGGDEDVRIMTKRLVRFRLCPTAYCSAADAGGCDSGYGDYILDMNEFLQAYWENLLQMCEVHEQNCGCDADDGENDQEDFCKYDCLMAQGLDYCVDENPYAAEGEEEEEKFEINEYLECGQFEFKNDEGRRLNQEEEIQYFLGPYCSQQGGAIYLGLFTDETCTTFADDEGGRETYYTNMGENLPYGEESVVFSDCMSCKEPVEDDGDNNNGDADEDAVNEACEQIYGNAGKCETSSMGIDYPNQNACNYMTGIKIIRQDGTASEAKSNTTASIFIGIFVVFRSP